MVALLIKKMRAIFSLNDPEWGKGSGQGEDKKNPSQTPPDLDELWGHFNKKLEGLLGKRPGSSGGGPSNGKKGFYLNGVKRALGFVIAIIILIWLSSGFFVVQEGQTGVVLTFGGYTKEVSSGLNWHWPYPIQSDEIVNVSQVRTVEVGYLGDIKNKQPKEALMLTDDENIVDIQFAVQYKLKNAAHWIFSNREPERTVKDVAETAIREIVGRSKMDFVLYEGREQVALEVAKLMQQILDRYDSGVQVTNVTMQAVQPPEQVQAAFDDAVKAGQDRERQKNEGQAYANDVIPRARGAAARLKEESEAYRSRVVAVADGNAERFKQILVEYEKAPTVTRDRMYLETMQQIFTQVTKVIVDTKNNTNLISLPLDKIINQTIGSDNTVGEQKNTHPAANSTHGVAVPESSSSLLKLKDPLRERDTKDTRESREGR